VGEFIELLQIQLSSSKKKKKKKKEEEEEEEVIAPEIPKSISQAM
jgi:hypothetical protein